MDSRRNSLLVSLSEPECDDAFGQPVTSNQWNATRLPLAMQDDALYGASEPMEMLADLTVSWAAPPFGSFGNRSLKASACAPMTAAPRAVLPPATRRSKMSSRSSHGARLSAISNASGLPPVTRINPSLLTAESEGLPSSAASLNDAVASVASDARVRRRRATDQTSDGNDGNDHSEISVVLAAIYYLTCCEQDGGEPAAADAARHHDQLQQLQAQHQQLQLHQQQQQQQHHAAAAALEAGVAVAPPTLAALSPADVSWSLVLAMNNASTSNVDSAPTHPSSSSTSTAAAAAAAAAAAGLSFPSLPLANPFAVSFSSFGAFPAILPSSFTSTAPIHPSTSIPVAPAVAAVASAAATGAPAAISQVLVESAVAVAAKAGGGNGGGGGDGGSSPPTDARVFIAKDIIDYGQRHTRRLIDHRVVYRTLNIAVATGAIMHRYEGVGSRAQRIWSYSLYEDIVQRSSETFGAMLAMNACFDEATTSERGEATGSGASGKAASSSLHDLTRQIVALLYKAVQGGDDSGLSAEDIAAQLDVTKKRISEVLVVCTKLELFKRTTAYRPRKTRVFTLNLGWTGAGFHRLLQDWHRATVAGMQ